MKDAALEKKVFWLTRRIARAQREFGMFADNDRVAIALSGGKDSLALLRALPVWAAASPLSLGFGAVHVEVEGAERQRDTLVAQAAAVGVPLSFTSFTPEPEGPGPGGRTTHPCFRCARLRREALLRWAADNGWNKVALGHHLEDDAETVLMNLLYQGQMAGLAPSRPYFDGAVTFVRPLIMAEEKQLVAVSRLLRVPLATCACPDGRPEPPASERQRMKAFLRSLGSNAVTAKRHLHRAARRGDQAPSSREVGREDVDSPRCP